MSHACSVTWPRISSLGLRAVRTGSKIPWTCSLHTKVEKVFVLPQVVGKEAKYSTSRWIFHSAYQGLIPISSQCARISTGRASRSLRNKGSLRRLLKTYQRPLRSKSSKSLNKDLSQGEILEIFGPTVSKELGNWLLHGLQKQRITGTLDQGLSAPGLSEHIIGNALAWLRVNFPLDEDAAIIARLEEEERQVEQDILARAERVGIYQPQQTAETTGIYGKSELDAIREHYEAQLVSRQAKEIENAAADSAVVKHPEGRAVLARRAKSAEWVQKYKDKAILSTSTTPPPLNTWTALYPSALVVLLVVGLSVLIAQNYYPPPRTARLFPDIPPAAATTLALIAGNALIFVVWRLPPLWRFMNKYFLMVPGSPRAWSTLGNVVSHQKFSHYLGNMAVLWFIGNRLHDDIGRANFLAVYFSSGVLSSFFSLSSSVLRKHLITSSLGASGAMAGVIATWCSLHSGEMFSFIFLPERFNPALSSNFILAALFAFELVGIVRGSKNIDHWAHLGGYMTGLACAQALRYRQQQRKQAEADRQKKMGLVDRIKEGRI